MPIFVEKLPAFISPSEKMFVMQLVAPNIVNIDSKTLWKVQIDHCC